jgi:predicted methyltransferase
LNKHQKNNQTYLIQFKNEKMKKQTGIWIDSTKAIIVTLQDGKEAVSEIQSDLENRVYHDQEGDKGSFSEVSTWTHKVL